MRYKITCEIFRFLSLLEAHEQPTPPAQNEIDGKNLGKNETVAVRAVRFVDGALTSSNRDNYVTTVIDAVAVSSLPFSYFIFFFSAIIGEWCCFAIISSDYVVHLCSLHLTTVKLVVGEILIARQHIIIIYRNNKNMQLRNLIFIAVFSHVRDVYGEIAKLNSEISSFIRCHRCQMTLSPCFPVDYKALSLTKRQKVECQGHKLQIYSLNAVLTFSIVLLIDWQMHISPTRFQLNSFRQWSTRPLNYPGGLYVPF